MTTRCSFFIGDGEDQEHLGDLFMDGYYWNSGIQRALKQRTKEAFIERVNEVLDDHNKERRILNMSLYLLDYHYHFMPEHNHVLVYHYGEKEPRIWGSPEWFAFAGSDDD